GLEALRPTVSTTVALPVVGCLCGVCQAGVSCVKPPKCPPTQSDTQAHPVGATSVYMTQAVTSHIRQAVWAWESCVRPEAPVRGSVMYHYTGVVPYAIAKAARPYPQ